MVGACIFNRFQPLRAKSLSLYFINCIRTTIKVMPFVCLKINTIFFNLFLETMCQLIWWKVDKSVKSQWCADASRNIGFEVCVVFREWFVRVRETRSIIKTSSSSSGMKKSNWTACCCCQHRNAIKKSAQGFSSFFFYHLLSDAAHVWWIKDSCARALIHRYI